MLQTSCLNTYPFLKFLCVTLEELHEKTVPVKRTMESMSRTIILFVFFTICVSKSVISCAEISSHIVLDSEENERDSNNASPKISVDASRVSNQEATLNSKLLVPTLHSDGELAKLSNAMKRSHLAEDNLTKQPTITNNIQIAVHENLLNSDRVVCKNAICNVSVSSRQDENGNIVIDLHIGINAKLNAGFKSIDIPIIDGVRGIENSLQLQHLNRSRAPTYLHNNIPHIQSRYQGGEPWYQGRRTFEGAGISRPRYSEESGAVHSARWLLNKPVVDDKIEPPLSKTS